MIIVIIKEGDMLCVFFLIDISLFIHYNIRIIRVYAYTLLFA